MRLWRYRSVFEVVSLYNSYLTVFFHTCSWYSELVLTLSILVLTQRARIAGWKSRQIEKEQAEGESDVIGARNDAPRWVRGTRRGGLWRRVWRLTPTAYGQHRSKVRWQNDTTKCPVQLFTCGNTCTCVVILCLTYMFVHCYSTVFWRHRWKSTLPINRHHLPLVQANWRHSVVITASKLTSTSK